MGVGGLCLWRMALGGSDRSYMPVLVGGLVVHAALAAWRVATPQMRDGPYFCTVQFVQTRQYSLRELRVQGPSGGASYKTRLQHGNLV